jgi:Protein of unknown function (DUF2845)
MKKNAILILAVIVAGIWGAAASAQTVYRCNSQLVSVGDRKFTVGKKCGEPVSREFIGERTTMDKGQERTDDIEEWVFDLRYGFFDILTFEGGKLVKIEAVRK